MKKQRMEDRKRRERKRRIEETERAFVVVKSRQRSTM